MKALKAQARDRFHRLFEMRSGPVLQGPDGHTIDLSDMGMWGANHGGYAFVIIHDPGSDEPSGRFGISIRSHDDPRSNLVEECAAYGSITEAKDACYDNFLRFRSGDIPVATPSRALAGPGEKGVEVRIIGGMD